MKERLLISACLIGANCKYSGGSNALESGTLRRLRERYSLVPVCPELCGGLGVPRTPCERRGALVRGRDGVERTEAFARGAEIAARLCDRFGCGTALLKERSPSCGSKGVYDGSFSGVLIPGDGVTAELLRKKGIRLLGESEIDGLLR